MTLKLSKLVPLHTTYLTFPFLLSLFSHPRINKSCAALLFNMKMKETAALLLNTGLNSVQATLTAVLVIIMLKG